jgi:hypothetical protein
VAAGWAQASRGVYTRLVRAVWALDTAQPGGANATTSMATCVLCGSKCYPGATSHECVQDGPCLQYLSSTPVISKFVIPTLPGRCRTYHHCSPQALSRDMLC